MDLPDRLGRAYAVLAEGLRYAGSSDGDVGYDAFSAVFASGTEVTEETFRTATALDTSLRIEIREADHWLDETIASYQNDDPGLASAYDHLRRAMIATLDTPLFLAGAIAPESQRYRPTRRYVFGRVAGGGLAGLLAYSVET